MAGVEPGVKTASILASIVTESDGGSSFIHNFVTRADATTHNYMQYHIAGKFRVFSLTGI